MAVTMPQIPSVCSSQQPVYLQSRAWVLSIPQGSTKDGSQIGPPGPPELVRKLRTQFWEDYIVHGYPEFWWKVFYVFFTFYFLEQQLLQSSWDQIFIFLSMGVCFLTDPLMPFATVDVDVGVGRESIPGTHWNPLTIKWEWNHVINSACETGSQGYRWEQEGMGEGIEKTGRNWVTPTRKAKKQWKEQRQYMKSAYKERSMSFRLEN